MSASKIDCESENGSIDDDERSSGYNSDEEYDLRAALVDGEDDGEDEDIDVEEFQEEKWNGFSPKVECVRKDG